MSNQTTITKEERDRALGALLRFEEVDKDFQPKNWFTHRLADRPSVMSDLETLGLVEVSHGNGRFHRLTDKGREHARNLVLD